jgi:hypothetical protein
MFECKTSGRADEKQMDLDVNPRRANAVGKGQHEDEEEVGANGKIRIIGGDGESFGFCRPGDEDCG